MKEFLGVWEIRLYDPCVPRFSTFPAGLQFDGVISTDVLEHIPNVDLPWVVGRDVLVIEEIRIRRCCVLPREKATALWRECP